MPDDQDENQFNQEYDKRYPMAKGQTFEGEGHPGRPLEPDQLPEAPPQFQGATQGARDERSESEAHPTTELSSTPKHKAGKPASGKHPTAELHIKPRGRR